MSEYLGAVQARIEGATKGPWSVYRTRVGTYVTRPDLLGVAREWSLVWQDADAEFIANARVDVPRLLAAVRAVEAITDELCEDIPEDAANASMKHAGKVIRRALTEALEGER